MDEFLGGIIVTAMFVTAAFLICASPSEKCEARWSKLGQVSAYQAGECKVLVGGVLVPESQVKVTPVVGPEAKP